MRRALGAVPVAVALSLVPSQTPVAAKEAAGTLLPSHHLLSPHKDTGSTSAGLQKPDGSEAAAGGRRALQVKVLPTVPAAELSSILSAGVLDPIPVPLPRGASLIAR